MYENNIDSITIRHEAKSRDGFALGAVIAAEFAQGKQGFYTMREVLGL
jgi:4-hydroxy-tetrahydrodipicolinate reductase